MDDPCAKNIYVRKQELVNLISKLASSDASEKEDLYDYVNKEGAKELINDLLKDDIFWEDINGKPDTFPASWEDIENKPESFPSNWANVKDKPNSFPTSWDAVTNKPKVFPTNWNNIDKQSIPIYSGEEEGLVPPNNEDEETKAEQVLFADGTWKQVPTKDSGDDNGEGNESGGMPDIPFAINIGGTGATNAKAAQYNILNNMETAATDINVDDYIIIKTRSSSTSKGYVGKASVDMIYKYIFNKLITDNIEPMSPISDEEIESLFNEIFQ